MSKAIGYRGIAKAYRDMDTTATLLFPLSTTVTAVKQLKRGDYSIFVSLAGAADISYEVTNDSPEAIAKGVAEWTGVTAKTAVALGDYYYGDFRDITGIRVTHIKNGSVADNAPIVAALGGRCQVRLVKIDSARPDQLALGGNYTGTFMTNPYA